MSTESTAWSASCGCRIHILSQYVQLSCPFESILMLFVPVTLIQPLVCAIDLFWLPRLR